MGTSRWCPDNCCIHVGDVLEDPVENGVTNGVSGDPPPPGENGDGGTDHGEGQEKQVKPEKVVKKIRVTYEEYRTIANLLILHLRQSEEASEEGR